MLFGPPASTVCMEADMTRKLINPPAIRKEITSGFLTTSLLVLFLLFVFRQPLLEASVYHGIHHSTGIKTHDYSLSLDLRQGGVWINNLKFFNPPGFEEELMLDMPQLYIDYRPEKLLKGSFEIDYLRVYLKKVFLIKNKKGELNLRQIKPFSGAANIPAGRMNLIVDEIIYKDYTVGREPVVQILDADIRGEFNQVSDIGKLIEAQIVKGIRRGFVKQVVDMGPSNLMRNIVFDSLTYTSTYLGKAAARIPSSAGPALKSLKRSFMSAFRLFRPAPETIEKDSFRLPLRFLSAV